MNHRQAVLRLFSLYCAASGRSAARVSTLIWNHRARHRQIASGAEFYAFVESQTPIDRRRARLMVDTWAVARRRRELRELAQHQPSEALALMQSAIDAGVQLADATDKQVAELLSRPPRQRNQAIRELIESHQAKEGHPSAAGKPTRTMRAEPDDAGGVGAETRIARTHPPSRAASLAEELQRVERSLSQLAMDAPVALGGKSRRRAPQRPEYRDWTRTAVAIAHRAPKQAPLDLAIEAGLESGELPPEAAEMPVATARRIARDELGLRRPKRHSRMSADYPMQAVQIDGSSSEHLVPVRRIAGDHGGEDWLLKLHRRPHAGAGYKNKPLGPHRHRVLVYALWDMCTGYVVSRYTVARGEDALGAMDFLCWALEDRGDSRTPLCGVPDDLWTDQGPLFKSAAADLLRRLGIVPVTGVPYQKERMGGVERSHRTRWSRFERGLFLGRRSELSLSETNARLAEFEARENASRPSRTKVAGRTVSRAAAWVALTNGRPADNRLRRLPKHPIETLAREARRRVDIGGIVRWGGREYEVEPAAAPRLIGRRVIVRRALAAEPGRDALAIEDPATGERALAHPYGPRAYGEVRSAPATPLERLTEADVVAQQTAQDVAGADLFVPKPGAGKRGVLSMPARTAAAERLENPLDVERHRDLDQAMRALVELYPHPLSPANRSAAAAHLERHNLERRAVVELANRLLALSTAVG